MRTALRRLPRAALGVAASILLSGCIVIETLDQNGQATNVVARNGTLTTNLILSTDPLDLVGVEFRLQYDPQRFDTPTCVGKIAGHGFFRVSAPQPDGALAYVKIMSFGLGMTPMPVQILVAECSVHAKATAPLGTTDLKSYTTRGSTAPTIPGAAGTSVALDPFTKTITIQ